jgi:DNA mismatch endonuclease (patch repair protein)
MPDKFSKEIRSKIMSKIRSKNTLGERILKKELKGLFLRQYPDIIGNPDFGSKKRKVAVFVDGCYWHKCPKCYVEPKSNRKYWLPKIERNVLRDKKTNKLLKKDHWLIIRVWEHELKKNPKRISLKIKKRLQQHA